MRRFRVCDTLPADRNQIVLYKVGAVTTSEEPIEINNDGTLRTELGPVKKMGN